MKEKPIGLFDSGIGGISILAEIIKYLPNEEYIYYADSLNNPYGSKNEDELLAITSNIVDCLLARHCKIIVIACNTATTICMNKLREKYPNVVFVGVVPAIKIAYDSNSKNTIVLATPFTVNSKRVDELVSIYKNDNQTITLVPCPTLANTIETKENDEVISVLKKQLKDYNTQNFDTVVLGCTHYSLIKDSIKDEFPNAIVVDGNKGIALEVKRQLESRYLLNDSGTGNIEYYNSDIDNKTDIFNIINRLKQKKN